MSLAKALPERLGDVRTRIDAAARRVNRSADEIALIAISKTHSADVIRAGLNAGLTDFGENRVQEAEGKILELGRAAARWIWWDICNQTKPGGQSNCLTVSTHSIPLIWPNG